MHGIRWILAALVLFVSARGVAATRLLVLPPVSEEAAPGRLAEIDGAVAAALSEAGGVEVLRPDGPTFCESTDIPCIADMGRSRGAEAVLHVSARPVGGTVSLLLSWIPVDGSEPQRLVEAIPGDVPLAGAVREQVVRLVAREHYVGSLVVDAGERSEIWLDGALRGVVPLPRPIDDLRPGQHLLRVVRPGGAEARSYVEIRYRTVTRVRIEPRSDEVSVLGYDGEAAAPEPAVAGGADAPAGSGWRIARWSLLGTGAVVVAAALVPALQAGADQDEREALRGADGSFPAGSRARERELRQGYQAGRTATTVLVGAGGALLAAGAGLWLAEELGQWPFSAQGSALDIDLGTDAAGASMRWEF